VTLVIALRCNRRWAFQSSGRRPGFSSRRRTKNDTRVLPWAARRGRFWRGGECRIRRGCRAGRNVLHGLYARAVWVSIASVSVRRAPSGNAIGFGRNRIINRRNVRAPHSGRVTDLQRQYARRASGCRVAGAGSGACSNLGFSIYNPILHTGRTDGCFPALKFSAAAASPSPSTPQASRVYPSGTFFTLRFRASASATELRHYHDHNTRSVLCGQTASGGARTSAEVLASLRGLGRIVTITLPLCAGAVGIRRRPE